MTGKFEEQARALWEACEPLDDPPLRAACRELLRVAIASDVLNDQFEMVGERVRSLLAERMAAMKP